MIQEAENSAKDFFNIMNRFRLLNKRKRIYKDIPQAEFFMLGTIWEKIKEKEKKDNTIVGIKVSELAAQLGTTMSATSKMLKGMEQKGYIERAACAKDRRIVFLKLTPKGEGVLKDAKQHMETMMFYIIEKMGQDDMKQLTSLLEKLYYIMKEEMEG